MEPLEKECFYCFAVFSPADSIVKNPTAKLGLMQAVQPVRALTGQCVYATIIGRPDLPAVSEVQRSVYARLVSDTSLW